ncbi:cytochrome b-c1 complex subunit 9 [Thermoascus aurantiacus ATCC 26904]
MAGISTAIYNTFFRKNAAFLATVFTGAFFFEIAFDNITNQIWDNMNKGRQWKDIRHKYIQKAQEEEE